MHTFLSVVYFKAQLFQSHSKFKGLLLLFYCFASNPSWNMCIFKLAIATLEHLCHNYIYIYVGYNVSEYEPEFIRYLIYIDGYNMYV